MSASVYLIHYAIFRDTHHIFIYLIGDIAFFFEVLLVTLVIYRVLSHREKQALLKKLNMEIGAFFTEVGTELLKALSRFDLSIDIVMKKLIMKHLKSNYPYLFSLAMRTNPFDSKACVVINP